MIEFVVAGKSNNGGHALSHNEFATAAPVAPSLGEAKKSKDHDRIQNDICDGTAKL